LAYFFLSNLSIYLSIYPSSGVEDRTRGRQVSMRLQQALLLLLLLALQGTMAVHEARHAAIMSTRGIQFKDPWISDDFVVGCIMIMFLLLFCFGKQ
jgi:hypothetical protein